MIENEIFKKWIPDFKKIEEYGFVKRSSDYLYEKNILNNSFQVKISIDYHSKITGEIFDLDLGEEYTSFRIKDNNGEFAGTIKNIYEEVLLDIRNKCFILQAFVSPQANRISKLINDHFRDEPSFEWDSFPDFGVFKNKNTNKWYALIMNISREKLSAGSGMFDIINIKLDPEIINRLLKRDGFYPAYHMNKKYWISIALDEKISDQEIFELISESYNYADDRRGRDAPLEWIIPANPRYYDIDEAFNNSDIITWKQSSNIKPGDFVYIYVASPISAIKYKCLVLKSNIPYSYYDNNVRMEYVMEIKLLKEYDNSLYSFSKLKEFGINSVRGPRFMPENLSHYINKN